jgi:hypothetical protein
VNAGFDPATPNMARVYDYWLGGQDHYAADRAEAEQLLGIYPPLRDLVRENRAFVTQAVSWAARRGTGQFIDLGAGLPACPAVHQAAHGHDGAGIRREIRRSVRLGERAPGGYGRA